MKEQVKRTPEEVEEILKVAAERNATIRKEREAERERRKQVSSELLSNGFRIHYFCSFHPLKRRIAAAYKVDLQGNMATVKARFALSPVDSEKHWAEPRWIARDTLTNAVDREVTFVVPRASIIRDKYIGRALLIAMLEASIFKHPQSYHRKVVEIAKNLGVLGYY